MTRANPLILRLVILVSSLLLAGASCSLDGPIDNLSDAATKIVDDATKNLNESVDRLHKIIDEQRGKLKQDALDILHTATNELDAVALRASSLAGLLGDKLAADVSANLQRLTSNVNLLTARLVEGTSDLVMQSARELQRTVEVAGVQMQIAVDNVGVLLAQAEHVGDRLVIRVADAGSMLMLRIIGAAVCLLCLIAVVIVAVKRVGTGLQVGFALGAAIGVGIAILAGPLASRFSLREVPVPDAEAACKTTEVDGARLVAELDNTAKSLARQNVLPMSSTNVQALGAEFRGGGWSGRASLGLSAGLSLASSADGPSSNLAEVASRVRDAAVICETYARSPTQRNVAKRMLALALSYLGVPVVCQSSSACRSSERCDLPTGRCLELGIYCELPDHCEKGKECDLTLHRCTAREQFACGATARCRLAESCLNGVCQDDSAVLGKQCEDPLAFGPCRFGVWERSGTELLCKQTVQATRETCDGVDNDCNNRIDDAIPPEVGGKCTSTEAVGACAVGISVCADGKPSCKPSGPSSEVCNNGVDEDCDGRVDNGCGPQPDCSGKQCGSDGAGGSCGACAASERCLSGQCKPRESNGGCQPACTSPFTCSGGTCRCPANRDPNCCDFDVERCRCRRRVTPPQQCP